MRGSEAPMDIDMLHTPRKDVWLLSSTAMEMDPKPVYEPEIKESRIEKENVKDIPEEKMEIVPKEEIQETTQTKQQSPQKTDKQSKKTARGRKKKEDLSTFYYLPFVIYNWAELIYKILILLSLIWFLLSTVWILYQDYLKKFDNFSEEIYNENYVCSKHYEDNKCHPSTRVPALIPQCLEWEKCMARDPLKIAGSKITATVLAEILESFVTSISYKTMAFLGFLLLVGLLFKFVQPAPSHPAQNNKRRNLSPRPYYYEPKHLQQYRQPSNHRFGVSNFQVRHQPHRELGWRGNQRTFSDDELEDHHYFEE